MRSFEGPKPRKPAVGGEKPAATETLSAKLDDIERLMERLRARYESYFLGLDRRAPEQERADLQRRLNDARKVPTSNTALRFRLESLVQRSVVLGTHWSRTMREIENGTYHRDVAKAQRHAAERARAEAAPQDDDKTQVD